MPGSDSPRSAERHWHAVQTIHQLFQYLDDRRFDEMAALFAADGVWVRQGANLTGPDAVLAAMRQRPTDLATRHLVTNMVTEDTPDGIAARYYVTTFSHQGETSGPAPLEAPQFIFVCEDHLVETDGAWKFASRAPRPVFVRPKG